jgi:predicted transcriptional regulator
MADADLEPSVFEQIDNEAEARALQQARADVAAGRVISHEAVVRWLRSWGTPNELPRPQCGE